MRQTIEFIKKPIVDILVAVAARGGGENCINMVGTYLVQKGFRVRVVQMIYEGMDWADRSMEFYYCYPTREDHELKDFIEGYAKYLTEKGVPNLVLATAWPMMAYVAKRAQIDIGENFTVASWLHAPLNMYEASGFGGGDFVKYADVHFAISDEIANAISAYDKEGVIYRVNNPVDLSKVHKVDELCKGTLLFVGRLSEEKNIGIILGAIALTKTKWKVRLVGEGDERSKLEGLAQEWGIMDRVEFVGWSDDPWAHAKGTYALILSSMYEGSPLVTIEALSCGLPVIGNVSSRVSEIVKPGKNGFIYEDGDAKGLAKILDQIDSGSFPEMKSEAIRQSVTDFRESVSLWDFYCKIFATINNRLISAMRFGSKDHLILTDKIDVIIPCYNVERYIARCLDSIISQTIGIDRIMIIAINDASSDGTLSVLEDYESRYPDSICIINCDGNAGPGKAREIGLNYVQDEYVFFVDADDCVAENLLEEMLISQKLYPSDVVTCEFEIFDGDEMPSDRAENASIDYRILDGEQERRQLFMDNSMLHPVWGKLYKTAFLNDNPDIAFPEGHVMEDIYFTYMAVAHAGTWMNLKLKGYYYYQNQSGIMQSDGRKRYYMDVFNMFVLAMDRYKSIGLFNSMSQELGYVYYKKVYKNIIPFVVGSFSEIPMENVSLVIRYMFDTFPRISENVYMTEAEKEEVAEAKELLI